ncbi:MAG: hypothetical protein M1142_04820, partial [Patescibacteria group bacterium]|nr:hypothetical protein [Patescibacteria group bacterium]
MGVLYQDFWEYRPPIAIITYSLPFFDLFNLGYFIGALAIVGYAAFTSSAVIFQSKLRYDLATLTTSVGA